MTASHDTRNSQDAPQTLNHRCITSFRHAVPYINNHRNKTFVIFFEGDALYSSDFSSLIYDIALLDSLGVRLVIVHGIASQLEKKLSQKDLTVQYVHDVAVTDLPALDCVKEAVGQVRLEIEALLSQGLANTPMCGARLEVVSGNFIIAKPQGVRHGVDYLFTGEVRRIEVEAIRRHLVQESVVLISPLGYSPTGELFALAAPHVACMVAVALNADKLIFLLNAPGVVSHGQNQLIQRLTPHDATEWLSHHGTHRNHTHECLGEALLACQKGVKRAHLLSWRNGALLEELFTREGSGTLVTDEKLEGVRQATIDDIGSILGLTTPLEAEGVLVHRSREILAREIDSFIVIERDGLIIGCAALRDLQDDMGEMLCLAVHPYYQSKGRGKSLLLEIEHRATGLGIQKLFVLTTHTMHWFLEQGFVASDHEALPPRRRATLNQQRNSKVLVKHLQPNDF